MTDHSKTALTKIEFCVLFAPPNEYLVEMACSRLARGSVARLFFEGRETPVIAFG